MIRNSAAPPSPPTSLWDIATDFLEYYWPWDLLHDFIPSHFNRWSSWYQSILLYFSCNISAQIAGLRSFSWWMPTNSGGSYLYMLHFIKMRLHLSGRHCAQRSFVEGWSDFVLHRNTTTPVDDVHVWCPQLCRKVRGCHLMAQLHYLWREALHGN